MSKDLLNMSLVKAGDKPVTEDVFDKVLILFANLRISESDEESFRLDDANLEADSEEKDQINEEQIEESTNEENILSLNNVNLLNNQSDQSSEETLTGAQNQNADPIQKDLKFIKDQEHKKVTNLDLELKEENTYLEFVWKKEENSNEKLTEKDVQNKVTNYNNSSE